MKEVRDVGNREEKEGQKTERFASDTSNRNMTDWVRMSCDFIFVVLGFLLGGTVGAGTVVAVFLTGPLVQFWLPRTKKLVQNVLKES